MAGRIRVGNVDIVAVLDMVPPPREPSMMFPTTSPHDWENHQDALEDGQLQLYYLHFFIRSQGKTIMVDTGMGPGPHPDRGNRTGDLVNQLKIKGVDTSDVDIVAHTHLHGDHVGWNVLYDGDTPRATFPNARYMIAKSDWDHWTSDEVAPNVPAIGRSVQPLEGLGVLHLVDGVEDVAPGVRVVPANGHTPGHQVVHIESNGEVGVIVGDLFHNVAQVTETEWCPMFDWNQDMARASRRDILGKAAAGNWTVFACHLRIGSNIGKVSGSGDRFTWQSI